jgi:hypothetical protein
MLLAGLLLCRIRPVWGMLVVAFVIQWLAFIVTRRYFLPLMPIFAYGWWSAALWCDRRFAGRPIAGLAGAFVLSLWIGPNLVRGALFAAEQHEPDFLAVYDGGRYEGIDTIAEAVTIHTPPDALLVAEGKLTAPLMVWTGRDAYKTATSRVRRAAALYAITPLPGATEERLLRRFRYGEALASAPRRDGRVLELRAMLRP